MATWNKKNIVITQVGEALLSKVIVGDGKLTISRIVTGAGYISPTELYKATEVSNIAQEAKIVGYDTSSNGSEILVQVDNTDLTEAYDLYQIGVYATHTDTAEEVLYLIAQCDTDNPDRLPLKDDTPVTFSYDLYVAHSGTDNVTINVSETGNLPSKVFYEFKTQLENTLNILNENITNKAEKKHNHKKEDIIDFDIFNNLTIGDKSGKHIEIYDNHIEGIDGEENSPVYINSKGGDTNIGCENSTIKLLGNLDLSGSNLLNGVYFLTDVEKSWIDGKFRKYFYGVDSEVDTTGKLFKIATLNVAENNLPINLRLHISNSNMVNHPFDPVTVEIQCVSQDGTAAEFPTKVRAFIVGGSTVTKSTILDNIIVRFNPSPLSTGETVFELYYKSLGNYSEITVEVLGENKRGESDNADGKYYKYWEFDTTNTEIDEESIVGEEYNISALSGLISDEAEWLSENYKEWVVQKNRKYFFTATGDNGVKVATIPFNSSCSITRQDLKMEFTAVDSNFSPLEITFSADGVNKTLKAFISETSLDSSDNYPALLNCFRVRITNTTAIVYFLPQYTFSSIFAEFISENGKEETQSGVYTATDWSIFESSQSISTTPGTSETDLSLMDCLIKKPLDFSYGSPQNAAEISSTKNVVAEIECANFVQADFYVSSYTTPEISGILSCILSVSGSTLSSSFVWKFANSGIDISKYSLIYKQDSTTSKYLAQIISECDSGEINFRLLENRKSSVDNITLNSEGNLTQFNVSDCTEVQSTLLSIINPVILPTASTGEENSLYVD